MITRNGSGNGVGMGVETEWGPEEEKTNWLMRADAHVRAAQEQLLKAQYLVKLAQSAAGEAKAVQARGALAELLDVLESEAGK